MEGYAAHGDEGTEGDAGSGKRLRPLFHGESVEEAVAEYLEADETCVCRVKFSQLFGELHKPWIVFIF